MPSLRAYRASIDLPDLAVGQLLARCVSRRRGWAISREKNEFQAVQLADGASALYLGRAGVHPYLPTRFRRSSSSTPGEYRSSLVVHPECSTRTRPDAARSCRDSARYARVVTES